MPTVDRPNIISINELNLHLTRPADALIYAIVTCVSGVKVYL